MKTFEEFTAAVEATIGTPPTRLDQHGNAVWVIVLEKGSLTVRPYEGQGIMLTFEGIPEELAHELGANRFSGAWNILPRAEAIYKGEGYSSSVRELRKRLARIGYVPPVSPDEFPPVAPIPAVRLTGTAGQPYAGLSVVEVRRRDADGALEVVVERVARQAEALFAPYGGPVFGSQGVSVQMTSPDPEQREGPDALPRSARMRDQAGTGMSYAGLLDEYELLEREATGKLFTPVERAVLLELLKQFRRDIGCEVEKAGFTSAIAGETAALADSIIGKLEP